MIIKSKTNIIDRHITVILNHTTNDKNHQQINKTGTYMDPYLSHSQITLKYSSTSYK